MSKYADEGTIAHALAAMCLTEGKDAAAYIGRLIEAEDYEHAKLSPSSAKRWMTCAGSHALIQANAGEFEPRWFQMEVSDDMAEGVQVYLDMVRARIEQYKLAGAVSVELFVEQSLPIDHITGEQDATGTGDVVLVVVWADGTALINPIDLKFGMGVEVDVVGNEQLLMYGSGALRNLDLLYDFTHAVLTVHQPRIKTEPSDWEICIGVIREFEEHAGERAKDVHIAMQFFDNWRDGPDYSWLTAGDHCRTTFCDARAVCPKLREAVIAAVFETEAATVDDFVNLDAPAETPSPFDARDNEWLAAVMDKADMIEDFVKATRGEVERRLLAGVPIPRYKLVQGKRGNRSWGDEKAVEVLMKSMRLKHDVMFDYSLISPTSAEKLAPKYDAKGKLKPDQPETVIGHKQWVKLKDEITQSDGKPSVAPESDKRAALVIQPVENDFESLDAETDLAG